jgi:hypothetical protein
MNFDKLLQTLESDGTEKTAAAQGSGPDTALQEALRNSLEKTASAAPVANYSSNPVDDLEKLAEQIASTEKEAEVIHAANMGRAFADAALEEFSSGSAKIAAVQAAAPATYYPAPQVNEAEVENAVKLAAEIGYNDTKEAVVESQFQEKIASADPMTKTALVNAALQEGREDLVVKVAADEGYRDTQIKIAAAEYERGQSDAIEQVHAVAANEFIKGAQEANMLIQRARSGR